MLPKYLIFIVAFISVSLILILLCCLVKLVQSVLLSLMQRRLHPLHHPNSIEGPCHIKRCQACAHSFLIVVFDVVDDPGSLADSPLTASEAELLLKEQFQLSGGADESF